MVVVVLHDYAANLDCPGGFPELTVKTGKCSARNAQNSILNRTRACPVNILYIQEYCVYTYSPGIIML